MWPIPELHWGVSHLVTTRREPTLCQVSGPGTPGRDSPCPVWHGPLNVSLQLQQLPLCNEDSQDEFWSSWLCLCDCRPWADYIVPFCDCSRAGNHLYVVCDQQNREDLKAYFLGRQGAALDSLWLSSTQTMACEYLTHISSLSLEQDGGQLARESALPRLLCSTLPSGPLT